MKLILLICLSISIPLISKESKLPEDFDHRMLFCDSYNTRLEGPIHTLQKSSISSSTVRGVRYLVSDSTLAVGSPCIEFDNSTGQSEFSQYESLVPEKGLYCYGSAVEYQADANDLVGILIDYSSINKSKNELTAYFLGKQEVWYGLTNSTVKASCDIESRNTTEAYENYESNF